MKLQISSTSPKQDKSDNTESASGAVSADEEKKIAKVNYGEAEIPDIPYEKITEDGSAIFFADDEPISGALDAVIFEIHTVGDYTLTLVGEKVRTDLANFPIKYSPKVFTLRLRRTASLLGTEKASAVMNRPVRRMPILNVLL